MSVQHKFFLTAVIVTVISSGCTELDQFPNQVKTANAPVSDVSDAQDSATHQLATMHDSSKVDIAWVFQYYRLISTVPPKVLNDEYEKTKKDLSKEKTVWNQWQMAMLLSLPSAPFYDPGRSSILFKSLAETSGDQDPVINDAAFLMYSWIKEQHQAYKRAVDLEGQLSKSRSENKTLQDQLKALKAIEENLYQRNKVEVLPEP
jgi:hypothetical protein